MNEITQQVRSARRRLNLREFLRLIAWSLTVALVVTLIGLAIPRIWFLEVDPQVWTWSWIGGGAGIGLFVGWLLAFMHRRTDIQAAIELDRRYGLKERVASSLSLREDERETVIGQALLQDAQRRLERVDLREHFQLGLDWKTLLPLIPALAMFLLVSFVPHTTKDASASSGTVEAEKARIQKAVAELEKKFELKKSAAKEKHEGLKDADSAMQELAKKAEKLKDNNLDNQKDALVKLNDLAKEAEKRRNELGASESLKKQLEDLKQIEKGPGEKLTDALRDGDMAKAALEMQKLVDKLKKGELDKDDREKLANQLDQVKQKIEQLQKEHEQKKQQLKDEIEKQKNQGNAAEAARLQEKLEKMEAQDQHMKNGLQKMADKMGQAAQNLREGKQGQNDAAAQEAMQGLADDLQKVQDELEEMEGLDEAMNQIQDAKNAMNCEKCKGGGCKACQGKGQGNGGKGEKPGDGLGEGRGFGDRPEEENATKGYDSRVRTKVQKGPATRIGDASGPNLPGRAKENVKEEVAASLVKDADPIDESSLPRDQREHSKEYFEKLLKGE